MTITSICVTIKRLNHVLSTHASSLNRSFEIQYGGCLFTKDPCKCNGKELRPVNQKIAKSSPEPGDRFTRNLVCSIGDSGPSHFVQMMTRS